VLFNTGFWPWIIAASFASLCKVEGKMSHAASMEMQNAECQKCVDNSGGVLAEIPYLQRYGTCQCSNQHEDSYACDTCASEISGNFYVCGNLNFCDDDCLEKHDTPTDELRKVQKICRLCNEVAKTTPFVVRSGGDFQVLFAWPGMTLPENAIPESVFELLCTLHATIGHKNTVERFIGTQELRDSNGEGSAVQSALKKQKIAADEKMVLATKCCEEMDVLISGIQTLLSSEFPIRRQKVSLATLIQASNEAFFRGKRSEDDTCVHGFTSVFVPGQKFQYPTVGAVLNPSHEKYLQPQFHDPDETILFFAWMKENHGELLERIMS